MRLALLAGAIVILTSTAFYWNAWRELLTREEPLVVVFREDFEDENYDSIPGFMIYKDWIQRDGALRLDKQGKWGGIDIKYHLPEVSDRVFIRLWMQGPPLVTNEVEYGVYIDPDDIIDYYNKHQTFNNRSRDNRSWGIGWSNWRGSQINFNRSDESETIYINIRARLDSPKFSSSLPVIQKIETGYYQPEFRNAPHLPLILICCFIVFWCVLIWINRNHPNHSYFFHLSTTFIFLGGAWLRWGWFLESAGQPLSPDGQGFLQIIQTMSGPYDTAAPIAPWVREPFFAWIGWLWFCLTPDTANALRLLTTLLSIGAIWAAYEAGRRLIHPFAGFAAALFMAFNDYLIWSAPRGLREELFTILTLWIVMLFFELWKKPVGEEAACGVELNGEGASCGMRWGCSWKWFAVAASLLVLTRITSLAIVLPMIAALAATRRLSLRHAAYTLAIIAITLSPHLMFNYYYSEERDPFFSANVHARYYRNAEFAGQPGFPSVEVVAADPYAGGPISSAGYIFGLHSPGQWVKFPVKGLVEIFATDFAYRITFSAYKFLLAIYAVAFLLTFAQRRWWGLGAVLLLLAGPVAFVVGAGKVDPRLLTPFMPFQYFILAIGLLRLRELIRYARATIQLKSKNRSEQNPNGQNPIQARN